MVTELTRPPRLTPTGSGNLITFGVVLATTQLGTLETEVTCITSFFTLMAYLSRGTATCTVPMVTVGTVTGARISTVLSPVEILVALHFTGFSIITSDTVTLAVEGVTGSFAVTLAWLGATSSPQVRTTNFVTVLAFVSRVTQAGAINRTTSSRHHVTHTLCCTVLSVISNWATSAAFHSGKARFTKAYPLVW